MNTVQKSVKIASMFIDESGAKNTAGGQFVVGFVKTYNPSMLWREVRDKRQRNQFHDEIKFSAINGKNIEFYFDIVETIANSRHVARLGGSVYDASNGFTDGRDTWLEQADMARKLIVGNINRDDHMICFLDLVQTPRGTSAAAEVKRLSNRRLVGDPVLEAYDVDSTAHDLVQLADVVASSINHIRTRTDDHVRPNRRKSPKRRVAERLMRALELDSFDDVKRGRVNVLTMGVGQEELPGLDSVEKLAKPGWTR